MGSITRTHEVEIIDIRIAKTGLESALRDDILSGLRGAPGLKTLPTLLLYNEPGLKIFEDITYLDEYYLTNTEIGILTQYADSIADRIEDGGIIVELGSGNLRKVEILLHALDRLGKRITYYALDLDRTELIRTLLAVPAGRFRNIRCVGLHGTYDDGRAWLQKSTAASRCVLWLGSSAGNFSLEGVAAFLRTWAAEALREGSRDSMLVGLDGCKDGEKVLLAYNDPKGLTRDFILNGLWNANAVLGTPHFVPGEWEYVGEWNAEEGRHQAYYKALRDIVFTGELAGVTVTKGERINVEYSYKFDASESRMLWSQSGLMEGAQWGNSAGDYFLHMLYKPAFFFPLGPASTYAPEPAPTLVEWRELWAAWDAVTLGMIPRHMLLSQPIDLRNPCIFYLGHIPTFLDVHIARATGTALTAPGGSYFDIFQRGIDPDVDNPQQCHDHSSTPDVWPPLDDITRYAGAVRARVAALYNPTGSISHAPHPLQRALWLAFEHEAMHLETLLYMLLQSNSVLPPPGVTAPDFTAGHTTECGTTTTTTTTTTWVEIPELHVTIGTVEPRYFGWDNEKPPRTAVVAPFKISPHPITNAEYARFIHATSGTLPASWTTASTPCAGPSLGDFLAAHCAKTLFGPVSLTLAGDWPVMASYDELAGCAKWAGGRIPSAEEMHAVYTYVESIEAAEKTLAKRIDAVNGHLVNNGVCESPPSVTAAEDAFADLRGRNVGFKNWHPTSVRGGGYTALGRGAAGGAWEWTSTVLTRHKGFIPEPAYPEYTADFFDGKHNIVLGGSWATHPRIAGRRSFVNWYQRGYRYAWATARIVAVEETA